MLSTEVSVSVPAPQLLGCVQESPCMSLSHQLLWRKVPLGIMGCVSCSHSFLPHRQQQEAGMENKEQCRWGHTRTVVVNLLPGYCPGWQGHGDSRETERGIT